MKQMRYHGFYYQKDKFADSRAFYKDCLDALDGEFNIVGVSEECAKENLEFFRRFPPGEHSRLSAHNIDIYLVKNATWVEKGELIVPKGSLEKVLTLDFGSEIKKICEEEASASEVLGDAVIDLGDGTVVQGMRIRKSRYSGMSNKREIPNEHLVIFFNSSHYNERGDFSYSFDIDRSSITKDQPKEYHIRKYVLVDGEQVWEDTEIARFAFETRDGETPFEFHHLRFTKK